MMNRRTMLGAAGSASLLLSGCVSGADQGVDPDGTPVLSVFRITEFDVKPLNRRINIATAALADSVSEARVVSDANTAARSTVLGLGSGERARLTVGIESVYAANRVNTFELPTIATRLTLSSLERMRFFAIRPFSHVIREDAGSAEDNYNALLAGFGPALANQLRAWSPEFR